MIRIDGRTYNQVRPFKITYNIFEYAPGSILFELGKTKILCSVTMVPGVPHFLKGTNTSWLTAEYAMLPASTQTRIMRESSTKLNGRSIEIARLIGRSLRSVVNLKGFGEFSINIDCDVVQADGGTRTASITAACLALQQAERLWIQQGLIKKPLLKEQIAAISAGIVQGEPMLDLNYQEDSQAQADLNFVLTRSGKLVELQGTAEGEPIAWDAFDRVRQLAQTGVQSMFEFFDTLS